MRITAAPGEQAPGHVRQLRRHGRRRRARRRPPPPRAKPCASAAISCLICCDEARRCPARPVREPATETSRRRGRGRRSGTARRRSSRARSACRPCSAVIARAGRRERDGERARDDRRTGQRVRAMTPSAEKALVPVPGYVGERAFDSLAAHEKILHEVLGELTRLGVTEEHGVPQGRARRGPTCPSPRAASAPRPRPRAKQPEPRGEAQGWGAARPRAARRDVSAAVAGHHPRGGRRTTAARSTPPAGVRDADAVEEMAVEEARAGGHLGEARLARARPPASRCPRR